MKIGLMVIATNKYIEFIDNLYESFIKYFFCGNYTEMYLFTNREYSKENVRTIKISHEPFPAISMRRYELIENYDFDCDYLCYLDADSLIVYHVGEEIFGNLVGTIHQGYINRTDKPFEKNANSTAYVESGDYYTGCFWGGKTEKVKEMARILHRNIDTDLKNGIIAKWHDESHLNKYFAMFPPDKKLNPSYNFSDRFPNAYPPIIKCLAKDFIYYRS